MANTNYLLQRLYKHCCYKEVSVTTMVYPNWSISPRRRNISKAYSPLVEPKLFYFSIFKRKFQEGTRIIGNYRENWVGFRIFEMLWVLIWSGSRVKPKKSRVFFLLFKTSRMYNLQKRVNSPRWGPSDWVPQLIMFVTLVVDYVVTLVVVTLVGDKIVTLVVDFKKSKS